MANHSLVQSLQYRGLKSLRALEQRFPQANGSLKALLADAGPFWGQAPYRDAFVFLNTGRTLTDQDAQVLLQHVQPEVDAVKSIGIAAVRAGLSAVSIGVPFPASSILGSSIGLPDVVIAAVIDQITGDLTNHLLASVLSGVAGHYGCCGGMAFAGLDYFLTGEDVPDDAVQPDSGPLRDYIWTRLLDSLDQNAGTFLEWVLQLHVLPVISQAASAAIGASLGLVSGPVGAVIGAFIAGKSDILGLGGPKVLVDRTHDQLDQIKQRLDAGPAWPLGLIFGDSPYVWDQHQLLALRYQDERPGRLMLTVWNNNDGRQEDTWEIDATGSELNVTWRGGHPIKGIFTENYNFRVPPAV